MIITRNGHVAFDTEVRDLALARSTPVVARADADGDTRLGRLVVGFTKFDTWYEVNSWYEGRFLERVSRGAFRKTIKERGPKGTGQIVTLFDHGQDFYVGDKPLALVDDIREDEQYGVLEGDLFDTAYNRDLAPGLTAGVYRSSFMFNVLKDVWSREPEAADHNPEGLAERTVTEVRLHEAGPVTFPANPAATATLTSAVCRSDTDRLYEMMARRDPGSVDALRSRILGIRTSVAQEVADSTTSEPAPGHSGSALRAVRQRRIREAIIASR